MLGLGKKKEDVAQPKKENKKSGAMLEGVTFHVMPSLEGVSDLSMAHSGGKAAPDKKGKSQTPESAIVKSANKEESLAPPQKAHAPPPKPAAPPVMPASPPAAHGAGKMVVSKKKFPVWAIALVVVIVAGVFTAGGWWWMSQGDPATPTNLASISSAPEPEQPTVSEPAAQIPPQVVPIEEPASDHFLAPRNLSVALDTDADLLSDLEEELYGTDPSLPDTDEDGWPDGWEIVNLYDPAAGVAARLSDSPLVSGFRNSRYGYAVLHPQVWVVQSVDGADPKEIVVTSATGEYINITAEMISGITIDSDEDLSAAVHRHYPGGSNHDLVVMNNKFGAWAASTEDGLTAFVGSGNYVWIFRYEPGLRSSVNFKRTMSMMVSGFFVDEPVAPQNEASSSTSTPAADPDTSSTATQSGI